MKAIVCDLKRPDPAPQFLKPGRRETLVTRRQACALCSHLTEASRTFLSAISRTKMAALDPQRQRKDDARSRPTPVAFSKACLYDCDDCGFEADRDVNAAVNLCSYCRQFGGDSLWRGTLWRGSQEPRETSLEEAGRKYWCSRGCLACLQESAEISERLIFAPRIRPGSSATKFYVWRRSMEGAARSRPSRDASSAQQRSARPIAISAPFLGRLVGQSPMVGAIGPRRRGRPTIAEF